jgi:mannose-6-phosphate isomerase-like protein (cupin superfamily)
MPIISSISSPTFELPFLSVTGMAAPSRGARETCVWRLTLAPGAPAVPHAIDREEIFVVLAGQARGELGNQRFELCPGDTLIVPAGQTFALANPGDEPFVAMAVMPVGGRAQLAEGEAFAPPWTQ